MSDRKLKLLGAGLAVLAGSALSCREVPRAPSTNWVLVTHNNRLTIWLDTTRIRSDSGFTRVEVRMDYGEAFPVPSDTTRRFSIAETSLDMKCDQRVARDGPGRLLDARGVQVGGGQGPDRDWTSFEQHQLSQYFFDPLCRALLDLKGNRKH